MVIGNGHSKGSTVATELDKARRNYVAIEQFYVAIELAKLRRNSVAIKDFWVAIELAITESSAAHDKVGRAKAGVQDSCCPTKTHTQIDDTTTEGLLFNPQ